MSVMKCVAHVRKMSAQALGPTNCRWCLMVRNSLGLPDYMLYANQNADNGGTAKESARAKNKADHLMSPQVLTTSGALAKKKRVIQKNFIHNVVKKPLKVDVKNAKKMFPPPMSLKLEAKFPKKVISNTQMNKRYQSRLAQTHLIRKYMREDAKKSACSRDKWTW